MLFLIKNVFSNVSNFLETFNFLKRFFLTKFCAHLMIERKPFSTVPFNKLNGTSSTYGYIGFSRWGLTSETYISFRNEIYVNKTVFSRK